MVIDVRISIPILRIAEQVEVAGKGALEVIRDFISKEARSVLSLNNIEVA